jgi:hypothetical protein
MAQDIMMQVLEALLLAHFVKDNWLLCVKYARFTSKHAIFAWMVQIHCQ